MSNIIGSAAPHDGVGSGFFSRRTLSDWRGTEQAASEELGTDCGGASKA